MLKFKLAVALIALSVSLSSWAAAEYHDNQGKIWRQPVETIGFTWNAIDALCATDGVAACGGTLSGWTWATQGQVFGLFNQFLPPTIQLSTVNPGVPTALFSFPFAYTTTFAMNGAPYLYYYAVSGWTATLNAQGEGIRGGYYEDGGPVSFSAGIGVNDPFAVDMLPGFLNETGIWLWKAAPTVVPIPAPFALFASGMMLLAPAARRRSARHVSRPGGVDRSSIN